jgi:hypothetical protein
MPDIVTARVDTRKLQQAIRKFDQRADAANIEGIVAETVLTAMDDLLTSEGRQNNAGAAWPPFSPVTYRLHPDRVGGAMLQGKTGQLAMFQPRSWPGHAEVKSPAPYGAYQAEGTKKLRGWTYSDDHGIPARDFRAIPMKKTLDEACVAIIGAIVR